MPAALRPAVQSAVRASGRAGLFASAGLEEAVRALSPYLWARSGPGATAAQWDDISGNAKHLVQATPALQPVVAADAFGRPCLRFDGVDDYMLSTFGVGLAQGNVVAVAVKFLTLDANNRYVFDGINADYRCGFRPTLTTHLWGMFAGTGIAEATEGRAVTDQWMVCVMSWDGSDSILRVDGREVISAGTDVGPDPLTGLTLGAAVGRNLNGHLEVAEVLVFDSVPSLAADMATIEQYLMARHGVGTALSLRQIAREATPYLSPHEDSNAYMSQSVRSDRTYAGAPGAPTQPWLEQSGTSTWLGTSCLPVKDEGVAGEPPPETLVMGGLTPGQNYSVWALFVGGASGAETLLGKFTRASDWDGRINYDADADPLLDRVVRFENGRAFNGAAGAADAVFLGNQVATLDGKIQFDFATGLGRRTYLYGGAVGAPYLPAIPDGVDVVWEDGAWNWFTKPVGLILPNGNYLVGFSGSDGRASVVNYDPSSKQSSWVPLSSWVERDDHSNPAFLQADSDTILAAYTRHGTTTSTEYRLSTGANALDPSAAGDWAAEVVDTVGPLQASYVQLLKAPDGRLFRAYRIRTNYWEVQYSDDHGATWSGGKPFVSQETPDNWSVYCHYAVDAQGRLHCHALAGDAMSQRGEGDTVHFYWDPETDLIHNSDGSVVRELGDTAVATDVELNASSTVMAYAGDERFLWVSDLKLDSDGTPVCVGIGAQWDPEESVRTAANRIWYYYGRYNSAAGRWDAAYIAAAGSGIATDRRGYAGEIVLNPLDVGEVAFCSNADHVAAPEGDGAWTSEVHQLYLGTLAADGTWAFAPQTNNTTAREANVRPQYIINDAGTAAGIIWMNGLYSSGGYDSLEYRLLALAR